MPESLRDSVLGFLAWDDRLQWWIGQAALSSVHVVEIFISPGNHAIETELRRVRTELDRIRRNDLAYRRWTAEHVLNDRWNSEEDMTVEEITTLLRLASIDFHSEGGAGLYWNDEDRLYGGHNLITEVDSAGNCVELRIEG